jgi:hypothetical protein
MVAGAQTTPGAMMRPWGCPRAPAVSTCRNRVCHRAPPPRSHARSEAEPHSSALGCTARCNGHGCHPHRRCALGKLPRSRGQTVRAPNATMTESSRAATPVSSSVRSSQSSAARVNCAAQHHSHGHAIAQQADAAQPHVGACPYNSGGTLIGRWARSPGPAGNESMHQRPKRWRQGARRSPTPASTVGRSAGRGASAVAAPPEPARQSSSTPSAAVSTHASESAAWRAARAHRVTYTAQAY